ncbi:Glu/Leu/Phe/Val dehydrogenase dimerization domain-containing protein [Labrenzia sp. 011]|uniref:Glu/Leu/Phe/Val dehydrogenase dimerization domain-containing protein n=1 Tax=Labrenzia sp. 011 TaxID=2171494 RepID=UPI000D512F6A|nr:Glu/Leu/Phe/Val dehydrogenase dimerization domain-containing protein [Labrenzia sp. 011]PVB62464.1 amino acid dehydrogenase [Labrenzia sp. 011]
MNALQTSIRPSTVFDHPEMSDHEDIVFVRDKRTGLRAIIAVHDTTLGPALGGCRVWPYDNAYDALTDALRLSRGMTYKNSLAGLDLGGGKAVIIADPRKDKSVEMMEAFGRHVERLAGTYITAEDVGVSPQDMEAVARKTEHVRGTSATGLGDPSPYTALGVFTGILACARHTFGDDGLEGRTVSVQGLGHVGFDVARRLHEAGAKLVVSDIHAPAVLRATETFGAVAVDPAEAHMIEADIFVPCALGAGLNARTVPQIRARIVAGAANNQLQTPADGEALKKRGILYAPDYVINAGGVISIALATPGGNDARVREKTEAIGDTLAAIFERAAREETTPERVADAMAEERLAKSGKA